MHVTIAFDSKLAAVPLNFLIKEIVVHEHMASNRIRHVSIEIYFNLKLIPEIV